MSIVQYIDKFLPCQQFLFAFHGLPDLHEDIVVALFTIFCPKSLIFTRFYAESLVIIGIFATFAAKEIIETIANKHWSNWRLSYIKGLHLFIYYRVCITDVLPHQN